MWQKTTESNDFHCKKIKILEQQKTGIAVACAAIIRL